MARELTTGDLRTRRGVSERDDLLDIPGVRHAYHLRRITLIGFLSREEPDQWPERLVAFVVELAREDFYGPTWAEIGEALRMSTAAVCERFGVIQQLRLA
jgi:hypothetical protein